MPVITRSVPVLLNLLKEAADARRYLALEELTGTKLECIESLRHCFPFLQSNYTLHNRSDDTLVVRIKSYFWILRLLSSHFGRYSPAQYWGLASSLINAYRMYSITLDLFIIYQPSIYATLANVYFG